MRFVLVTKWFTGLGFALRLQEEGHDVVDALVGTGLVDRRPLADVMADRERLRDAYWVWDENHSVDENELLRREGFRVFGGGVYANTMEPDRAACLGFFAEHGLVPPPSHRFETPH